MRLHTALTGIHPLHIASECIKKNIEVVCVSMDDLHEIICATLCIRRLSVQYNNKKRHLGFLFN